MKFYLAIEHIIDEEADYFQFNSLIEAISYINSNGLIDWTLTDRPFFKDEECSELIAQEIYQVIS